MGASSSLALAGPAHDLNHFLTMVIGGADLAKRDCARGISPVRHLDLIIEGARKAGEIARLFVSQRTSPPRELILPARFVGAWMGRSIAQMDGVSLRGLLGPCPAILADPLALERVLMNLAWNARDAGARTIWVTTTRTTRCGAVIALRDDGRGMSGETLARIFEPGFSTKKASEGERGLGLAIVREVVERAGGSIYARSEEGEGTAFLIEWPGAIS